MPRSKRYSAQFGPKQQSNDLEEEQRPLQTGLAWAGNPRHVTDRNRSLHLKTFNEMGVLSDKVAFVLLQYGAAAMQLAEGHTPFVIRNACSTAKDFADTAAIVAGLDLVITVDTAIQHPGIQLRDYFGRRGRMAGQRL